MFDYSVLTVDADGLFLASDINMDKARDLLVFFCLQEKSKIQMIFSETIDAQKHAITMRMMKAFSDNEIAYTDNSYGDFRVEHEGEWGYSFQNASGALKEIILWAHKVGIPIPDDFYSRVCVPEDSEKPEAEIDAVGADADADADDADDELSGNAKRDFERLKVERDKWNASIKAAVTAGLIAAKIPEGNKTTRKEMSEKLRKAGHKGLEDTTFDKIWKALPAEVRSSGGRPKEDKSKEQE